MVSGKRNTPNVRNQTKGNWNHGAYIRNNTPGWVFHKKLMWSTHQVFSHRRNPVVSSNEAKTQFQVSSCHAVLLPFTRPVIDLVLRCHGS